MTADPLAAAAFAALTERTAGDVVLVVDDQLRIIRGGVGAAGLADRPVHALAGMSLIAAFGSAPLDALARRALDARSPVQGEAGLGTFGGRIFAVDAVPLASGELVVSLHDITALRRAERVRRDFVANISHELRTPLASIKLLAETLSAGGLEDARTAGPFVAQIEREVDHLAQLVDELLDLSMIESGESAPKIEPVEPGSVIADVAERIGPVAARRGIAVRQLPEPADAEGIRAAADPVRLGQALLNLAHNAVKYNRPDGEVRIGWQPTAAGVRFSVADDGIGISEAHQRRIFERFYKVDRSREHPEADEALGGGSAGLGLAIVRHIAEAHGGSAGVQSTEGIGSTFWMELPRSDEVRPT
ncbi:MAG: HAMP domain-containing histidine kinase [Chloroflexota bacterium]|nr:HAMP domain-containing histidine kinase [Chloroflexota bacterium]